MRIETLLLTLLMLVGCTADQTSEPAPGPSTEVSATYEVFPPTVRFGDRPEATLRNTGNVPLEYGNAYLLEFDYDGKWVELSQPQWAEPKCVETFEAYLMDPGTTKTQKIAVCDGYGRPHPLAPGDYRITKRLQTIAATPEAEIDHIVVTASFDVAEPTALEDRGCQVLCISDTTVRPGDVITVTFDPPRKYTWGAGSELHRGSSKTAIPVAWLVGWKDRDKELATYFPGEGGGVEDIGFGGPGRWEWEAPKRLEPGIYAIAKDGIRGRPGSASMRQRQRWWSVAFEIVRTT